jgi:hypothetical protein
VVGLVRCVRCGQGDKLDKLDFASCVLGLGLVARVEVEEGAVEDEAEAEVVPLRMLLALPWVGVEDSFGTFMRKGDILGECFGKRGWWACYCV